jgi:hypothetical protein
MNSLPADVPASADDARLLSHSNSACQQRQKADNRE